MNYVSLENYERIKRLQIAETAAGNEGLWQVVWQGQVSALGVGQNLGATMSPGAAEAQESATDDAEHDDATDDADDEQHAAG